MTAAFVPGLDLAQMFHAEVVAPLLHAELGDAPWSTGLVGWGSEVQGFDTVRSTDHAWGPRLQVFLDAATFARRGADLDARLDALLPATFRGYPVRFAFPDGAAPRHWVHVVDVDAFFLEHLGVRPGVEPPLATWLTTPTQVLRELTGGRVFHDGLGVLEPTRRTLAWYPDDVWRYVLACQWERIAQEEPFVGRCGEVGDDLGSAVVAARLARDVMRLCLLLDRVYPPYSKWLGTAFARTTRADRIGPLLAAALAARTWTVRERELGRAYESVAALHDERGLTAPLDTTLRPFHTRPFHVLDAARFADALLATVTDPALRALPRVGAVDQYVDNTDLLDRSAVAWRRRYVSGPPV